jgi:hypothetical protein
MEVGESVIDVGKDLLDQPNTIAAEGVAPASILPTDPSRCGAGG